MSEDFDSFFVGDGSAALLKKSSEKLIKKNVFDKKTILSLANGPVLENDLDKFISDKIIIKPDKYYEIFLNSKKKAFKIFDFLSIKSTLMKGVALSAKDLIMDDSDINILEFAMSNVNDYFALCSIARTKAFLDMGIHQVMFKSSGLCPVCNAYNGCIFDTNYILNVLLDGDTISHAHCSCDYFPVIFREVYSGPLLGNLDVKEINISGKVIVDFPLEFKNKNFINLLVNLSYNKIKFTNIFYGDITGIEADEVVVYDEEDDVLYVHNGYVYGYGPDVFVREFGKAKELDSFLDADINKNDLETYYLDGKEVIRYDNHYWDAETRALIT